MTPIVRDKERRLIPRWRFTGEKVDSAEFAGDHRVIRNIDLDRQYLEEKLFDWERSPTLGNAIELVSCGVGGGWHEEVLSAARYLYNYSSELSQQANQLIQVVLPPSGQRVEGFHPESSIESLYFDSTRNGVAKARTRVRRDPRNALAWIDLARAYAILGHEEKAISSISSALFLAPNHRHVLRSARPFVHPRWRQGARPQATIAKRQNARGSLANSCRIGHSKSCTTQS